MKRAVVCGAGGFIGAHLVKRLKREGYWVRGVDTKRPEFSRSAADEFFVGDLRNQVICLQVIDSSIDEVYQLAADMGGAAYIFSGENDAQLMRNSALMNLQILERAREAGVRKIFYSSSACIYPEHNQLDPQNPKCTEASAYPASPDSEYGWEKLFSERLYLNYARNFGMQVRIARFHNIFGEEGTWTGGREKAPAALCRKVAQAKDGAKIEVWGDGSQTRSFLYIDECVEGIRRLMASDFSGPVNIGSTEMISIKDFTQMVIAISGKKLEMHFVEGPQGVRGRNSDNSLIEQKLGWAPSQKLRDGMTNLYHWVDKQVNGSRPRLKSEPSSPLEATF